ncbi:MAG: hypothetical protein H0T78_08530 [Longispora sp.]|nr:hypothetical protein [Longispora sp. (in: high G+C Gram-positive bacteria)]
MGGIVGEYFFGVHSAKSRDSGFDAERPAELVNDLWEEISPHAEEWRAIEVFGPEFSVSADAPLLDRLMGLAGRDPYNTDRLRPTI